jgi:hypothetical protein
MTMIANESDSDAEVESGGDVLRTDPVQRLKVQRLIIAMIVAAVLLLWLGLPALKEWVDARDDSVMIHRMAVVCYWLGFTLFATAGYACWYARNIFRSSQFPPPGTWVLRDTRLLRGDHARARGWWVMACAISFTLLALFVVIELPRQIEGLMSFSSMHQPVPAQGPHG